MDVIIFLKAVGNLLFAAILLMAVLITSTFSILVYLVKGFKPALIGKTQLFFNRNKR
ncbi:hypothetical protein [Dyadobacter sediminis]|uniref:hypothetical protein n=1 Tax=Dyadobacter sediminis TaxID=1493691 RepID=UPI0014866671|nr:hypothetical protein [Dyadobacter sediminis]